MNNTLMSLSLVLSFLATIQTATASEAAVGRANPAAVYCVETAGGTIESLSDARGEAGYCKLDRALVDEWTLFESKRNGNLDALKVFLNHPDVQVSGSGNPASLYCEKVGGKNKIMKNESGGELGVCDFSDNSSIEEWTLFSGPARNQKLAKFVQK